MFFDLLELPQPSNNLASGSVNTSLEAMVITVTAGSGGTGKSSVAVLLASQMVLSSKKSFDNDALKRPLNVCVLEMNSIDPSLSYIFNDTDKSAFDIAISRKDITPELIAEHLAYSEVLGVHGLLFPSGNNDRLTMTPKFYSETIDILRSMFDVIIIDTSVDPNNDFSKLAFKESDAVLYVTMMNTYSHKRMNQWIESVTSTNGITDSLIDSSQLGIIVNKIRTEGVHTTKVSQNVQLTRAANGAPIVAAISEDASAFANAINTNQLESLLLHKRIGPQYFLLATKILKAINIKVSPIIENKRAIPPDVEETEPMPYSLSADNNVPRINARHRSIPPVRKRKLPPVENVKRKRQLPPL